MIESSYTIKEENGIHARPAGFLVKEVKQLDSTITVKTCDGKSAAADKLFALMKLGVKQGDTITIVAEGGDEQKSLDSVMDFMSNNF
ncbi:MAG: HPr family phosphocarrier protein [Spirochaetales bacterium]|nr:HPr family phosphocarrier protein [Spirochaetales bacterium]